FHASYAVDRIPEPDLDPGPSADSPAPAPAPVESPESSLGPQQGVFDVNQYGATVDGETESSKAFLATWDAACSYAGNSTFCVPEGEFFVGPISFAGPCYNNQSLEVKIEGTLIAPCSLNDFPDSNWIEFKQLNGMVLYGSNGVTNFDAQGAVEAWRQISCRNSMGCKELIASLKFSNISDGTIRNVTLINSKAFHVSLQGSNNIIMKNITITAPWDSPNTDGIHISHSTNIRVISSVIGVGDDCVSMGPGSTNIFISDVMCGPGHGISIGRLGKYPNEEDVTGITVQNCTINGTHNGGRVKTWPASPASTASNITFQNIVMINVSNPNASGSYNSDSAVKLLCSSSVPCETISLTEINLNYTIPDNPRQGLNVKGVVNSLEVNNSSF
ncbi:hypothetical protein MANES_15G010301v8, partial [Manihot esculenta]